MLFYWLVGIQINVRNKFGIDWKFYMWDFVMI